MTAGIKFWKRHPRWKAFFGFLGGFGLGISYAFIIYTLVITVALTWVIAMYILAKEGRMTAEIAQGISWQFKAFIAAVALVLLKHGLIEPVIKAMIEKKRRESHGTVQHGKEKKQRG